MGDKFRDVVVFFQRFIYSKHHLTKVPGGAQFCGMDSKNRLMVRTEGYTYCNRPLRLALLDIQRIARPDVPSGTPLISPFLDFLVTTFEPSAPKASVWLWIIGTEDDFNAAVCIVTERMEEHDYLKSVHISCKAKRLDNITNQSMAANVCLMFLFKRNDAHANNVRGLVRTEYWTPDIPYYMMAALNNEAKWREYTTELRMEFYIDILQCFAVADKNVVGILVRTKFALASSVSSYLCLKDTLVLSDEGSRSGRSVVCTLCKQVCLTFIPHKVIFVLMITPIMSVSLNTTI